MYEYANKPNRYLANLLRNRVPAQNISFIKDSTGTHSYDNRVINDTFKTFYKQLYSSQLNPLSEQAMMDFFAKVDLPKITEDQRDDLCKPITLSEIKNCIQLLPNNKAPGPDGFNFIKSLIQS